MQAEMEKRHGDLAEAQDQIRRLEDQLRTTQAAKDKLELGQMLILPKSGQEHPGPQRVLLILLEIILVVVEL